ncbi:O-antigen ligase family protein [Egicoccus halophilus]|uniref:O-antigen ligase n=1 Tax=Egicoccus halophilus TaxID=1670830 RepID=A0A8J3ACU3_9ACTN|nr:hypothetical protein [Egicoccus halophilus]GGI05404.1 hypothetical protein GCM10011354_13930 [Egicoccus halophilus]
MMLLLVVLVGAGVALALTETVVRRTDVGVLLALGLGLFLEASALDLSVNAGPVRIGPNDLLFVVLATAAIARLLRSRSQSLAQRLLILLSVLVVWAVGRGAGDFGTAAAINEARKWFVFVAAALYVSTVELRRDLLDRLGWIWIGTALGFGALTMLRWAGNAAGVYSGVFGSDGSLRVIPAADTLFVLQAALLAFPLLLDRRRRVLRWTAPVLLVLVVVLQHRTVWVAGLAGVLYLLYRERTLATRALGALAAGGVVFLLLSTLVLGGGSDELSEQLQGSAQSTATFEWRVEGWVALIRSGPQGAAEVATGQPFGAGWTRTVEDGRVVDVSPHNFYVEAYLRVGIIGLAVLLGLYGLALRATVSRTPSLGAHDAGASLLKPSVVHVLLCTQLLFYIPYSPDAAQAVLFGLGLAMTRLQRPTAARPSDRPQEIAS